MKVPYRPALILLSRLTIVVDSERGGHPHDTILESKWAKRCADSAWVAVDARD
jgi:hypothetical protein